MFLFDGNECNSKNCQPKEKKNKKDAESKAAAKAKKIQQDDMESLQITFYEIESWIEKTSPVLAKMTKELERVSKHFDKGKKSPQVIKREQHIDLSSMQWSLSFQPNNSMRLETNIKSIEQLIDAVHKMQLVTESSEKAGLLDDEDFDTVVSSSISLSSSSTEIADHSIEYWNLAMLKRPSLCVDQYQNCAIALSKLTEQVSTDQLAFVCNSYWNCVFPKFSNDWNTFWNRSADPHRNQVSVDSGLAMVFTHIIRHNKAACPTAQDISYYYYERTRQALVDYFDSPDATIIEAILNTAMYSMIWKRYSFSRLYLELAYRMIVQLGYHHKERLPTAQHERKRYIRIFLVLYYIDMALSTYSSCSTLIDDMVHSVDFYELLALEDPKRDKKVITKDIFYVHLMELIKIHKSIQQMTRDYQEQHMQHAYGSLPARWSKKIQVMEETLKTWLDQVPEDYRTTTANHGDATRQRSALLLMLHYQMLWIALYKIFLSPQLTIPTLQNASYAICFDAANHIVIMAERIDHEFDWCVCQLFLSCVYQASTIVCKSILAKDAKIDYSKSMIRRIIAILTSKCAVYDGLPEDLMACLKDFLEVNTEKTNFKTLDHMLSDDFVQYSAAYHSSTFKSIKQEM